MTDASEDRGAEKVVTLADFVARRRGAVAEEAREDSRQLAFEFPAAPRPLTARSIEHRRRMLTHLVSAR